VLDGFNRANGAIGSSWSGSVSGYQIANNRLDVGTTEDIYWSQASYGADQEVFLTLTSIDPNASEIGLVLKSQSNAGFGQGMLDVLYTPGSQVVQVWTYDNNGEGWRQRGTNLPATFVNGDQFGVRARADGIVEIYKNGVLLGTRDYSAWRLFRNGGYLGLFNINAGNALLDDFGGGVATYSP
jgi:hypothetical protein